MNLSLYLKQLAKEGIELWLEGNSLRFRAPKQALSAARMAELKQHKPAIIALLKAQAAQPFPLSQGQQALWFLYQSAPDSAAYNIASALRIRSAMQPQGLQTLLQRLMQRHPCLQSLFFVKDGQPMQQVQPSLPFPLTTVDATNWSEQRLRQALMTAYQQPFDLTQHAPIRSHIFTRSTTEHVLLLTIHHIVFDAWSLWLFWDEFAQLVAEQYDGKPATLTPLTTTYADFVNEQQQLLHSAEGERLWRYWQQQMATPLPVLALPTDHPRPPLLRFVGTSHTLHIPPTLSRQLRTLTKQQHATPFSLLLATFYLLLQRYTGQDDILVGSPVVGRNDAKFNTTIGYFVNTVVLRGDLSANPSFGDFVTRVGETVWQALDHQSYPFLQLVKQLNITHDPSRSPLFQVSFTLQKPQQRDSVAGWMDQWEGHDESTLIQEKGVTISPFAMPQQEGQFDLTLELHDLPDHFAGEFKYSSDLFDARTIERMAKHFIQLLQQIVATPQAKIQDLSLLSIAEQQQFQHWNQSQQTYDTACLPQRFAAQALATPNAIALQFKQQTLSYADLNAQANQWAHYLLTTHGIKKGCLVGLNLPRSFAQIITLLAVFKTGAAYLPLDPNYPSERLAFMLRDADVDLLISDSRFNNTFVPQQIPLLTADTLSNTVAQCDTDNPNVISEADDLAYVIYTSGSSGKPKGVWLAHRGLSNLAHAQSQAFAVKPNSRVLQFASLNFDASISEIAIAFNVGACLCIADSMALMPGEALANYLQQQRISHVTLPPSVLALLPHNDFADLQSLIVAGESCAPDLAAYWAQGRRFFNAYGPTENTVCATIYEKKTNSQLNPLPIGRPIANVRCYILDRYLKPVPIGVSGELYLAGIGLADGYRKRPRLNAERFINAELFGKKETLYKTGDQACWLADGNIVYQGRLDAQVKLRGFRIELGEIETVLASHPKVRDVAVVVHEYDTDARLVAYIVKTTATDEQDKTDNDIDDTVLRTFAKQQLPDYMLPSAFVFLAALPLNPNGKIDRPALPKPTTPIIHPRTNSTTQHNAQTELELALTQIWEQVLGVQGLQLTDNFFDHGGHSLLAVQLLATIKQQMGKSIPLAVLLEDATIAQIVRYLHTPHDEDDEHDTNQPNHLNASPLIMLQAGNAEKTPLFCIHPVSGNVFCYHALTQQLSKKQPVYALQSVGLNDAQTPLTTIEAMASHYIEAIKSKQPTNQPYHLLGWSMGGVIAFEMAQQLQQQGHTIAQLSLLDSYPPKIIRQHQSIQNKTRRNNHAMLGFLHDIGRLTGKKVTINRKKIPTDEEAQLAFFLSQAQQQGLLPNEMDSLSMQRLFTVFNANQTALLAYQPQAYTGKVNLFRASQSKAILRRDNGWGKLIQDINIHRIKGDHYSLLQQPQLNVITTYLSTLLTSH